MFNYQTRQIPMNDQVEESINAVDGGYNLKEIIYSKKISRSESYGLITNQRSNEKEEEEEQMSESQSEA